MNPSADERTDEPAGEGLSSEEVKLRATRGVTMFIGRDVSVQFIGFLTSLVLARLLSPAAFGITTLGLTIVGAANILADGGVGASLISRKEPPTRAELSALNGVQLAITTLLTAIAIPIGFALGGDGPETAIILLALPFYSLRTPPLLLLERRLEFMPRILIQLTELVSYGVIAIALAIAGLGVWAMPIALVLRTLAGTAVAYTYSPVKWLRPTLRFELVRPLLGFGVRFQARTLVQLARDLTVVGIVGAVGGFTALGYYGFCSRLLSVPKTVSMSLGEVTFSAFSRLRGNGDDVGPFLERSTATSSIINAAVIAPLVAASPALIPLLFGQRWKEASLMLPGLGISLMVGGPLGWTIVNYLYAMGDAKTPLWVNGVLNTTATIGFTALFGVLFGDVGIGMGIAAGQIVTTPQLLIRVRRAGGPNLWRAVMGPAASASVAMGLGWWVCGQLSDTLLGALAAIAVATAVEVLLMVIADRAALMSSYRTIRRIAGMLIPARVSARVSGVFS